MLYIWRKITAFAAVLFSRGRDVSELVTDGLLSRGEVENMFETLPKAAGGSSIDLAGFVDFGRKVHFRVLV